MLKHSPPETFGVFKPVDHTVITLCSDDDMQAAMQMLLADGFPRTAIVPYTSQEMILQVDDELTRVNPLAAFGQELAFAKHHREQAEQGCSFLVVHTPHEVQTERVDRLVREIGAVSAQRYTQFIIEELEVQPLGEDVAVYDSARRDARATSH